MMFGYRGIQDLTRLARRIHFQEPPMIGFEDIELAESRDHAIWRAVRLEVVGVRIGDRVCGRKGAEIADQLPSTPSGVNANHSVWDVGIAVGTTPAGQYR